MDTHNALDQLIEAYVADGTVIRNADGSLTWVVEDVEWPLQDDTLTCRVCGEYCTTEEELTVGTCEPCAAEYASTSVVYSRIAL